MATMNNGIEKGMDVLDANGEKLGSVDDILSVQATSQTSPASTFGSGTTAFGGGDLGTSGYDTAAVGQGSYLKVNQGGILGIGAKHLYVPFSAVTNIVPGENLTIDCTKDTCGSVYGNAPEFLDVNS